MKTRAELLAALAARALAQYGADLQAGGEPIYPQWAKELQELLAERAQLVAALRAGRVAIDVLMASLIEADPSFRPTQSPAWPALVAIKNALDAAEAP